MDLQSLRKRVNENYNHYSTEFRDLLTYAENKEMMSNWYQGCLESLPPGIWNKTVFSTLRSWLIYGKEVVKKYDVENLQLVDRCPYYNKDRDIWYFYCNHSEDQLSPNKYVAYCDIPFVWLEGISFDKKSLASDGGYYDAKAINGWTSKESALDALNKSALRWARNS